MKHHYFTFSELEGKGAFSWGEAKEYLVRNFGFDMFKPFHRRQDIIGLHVTQDEGPTRARRH